MVLRYNKYKCCMPEDKIFLHNNQNNIKYLYLKYV